MAGGLVFFCGLLAIGIAGTRRRSHPQYVGRVMLAGATAMVASVAFRAGAALGTGDTFDAIASILDGFAIIVAGYAGVVAYLRFKRERSR
ncbi:MAG: hypothetical protein JWO85_1263 [Candidatus Eremiobacteraeota bacterium]|nr:hypothetical protein [Candidatus Eremiobacteraeota bacterium]